MTWMYEGKEFVQPADPKDAIGFVYLITEIDSGKMYVGKKLLWKPVRKKVGTKLRRVLVPSDWPNYYGSSTTLKKQLESLGKDGYSRQILRLCKSKSEMTYYEIKEQIDRNVLFDEMYYNDFIGGKVRGKWLK